jgi:hypothetical protein
LPKEPDDILNSQLRALYGPIYLERENQLPWLVGWILLAASDLSNTDLIGTAADVMNAMLDVEAGNVAIRVAQAMGHGIEFLDEDEVMSAKGRG